MQIINSFPNTCARSWTDAKVRKAEQVPWCVTHKTTSYHRTETLGVASKTICSPRSFTTTNQTTKRSKKMNKFLNQAAAILVIFGVVLVCEYQLLTTLANLR